MALSSSELKESPSSFEREEIGPRLSNDQRVVLSLLKKKEGSFMSTETEVGLYLNYENMNCLPRAAS